MQPPNQHELIGVGTRILLVDDEPTVRNSITEILQIKGYEVFQAENGRRALEIFEAEAQNIDLILLDMTMPVLTGLETLQKIREKDGQLPIILLSGYGEMQVDNLSLDLFNTRFLKKPFKVELLLQNIHEILHNNRPHIG
jgi:DNA-binding response OmpR family regulator